MSLSLDESAGFTITHSMSPLLRILASLAWASLFVLSGPLAVLRAVRTVPVFSIDGVLWRRPWSHVRKERLERIFPSFANTNAATAVSREVRVLRIHTTHFHVDPSAIRAGMTGIVRIPLIRERVAVYSPALPMKVAEAFGVVRSFAVGNGAHESRIPDSCAVVT